MRFLWRGFVLVVVSIILTFYLYTAFHHGFLMPMKVGFSVSSFRPRSDEVSPSSIGPHGMCVFVCFLHASKHSNKYALCHYVIAKVAEGTNMGYTGYKLIPNLQSNPRVYFESFLLNWMHLKFSHFDSNHVVDLLAKQFTLCMTIEEHALPQRKLICTEIHLLVLRIHVTGN